MRSQILFSGKRKTSLSSPECILKDTKVYLVFTVGIYLTLKRLCRFCSRRHYLFLFSEKIRLHINPLPSRQFIRNVKPHFLWKMGKKKKRKKKKCVCCCCDLICPLTFFTLWAYSAKDKLMLFILFFPINKFWHFMQIVSNVKSCFLGKNKENISVCRLLKILPRVLRVKA